METNPPCPCSGGGGRGMKRGGAQWRSGYNGISLSGVQTFSTVRRESRIRRKKAAPGPRRRSYKSSGQSIHFIIVWKSSELYETFGFLFTTDRNF